MTTTGLYFDPLFVKHEPGAGHPESPARLSAIKALFDRAPLPGTVFSPSRPAAREALAKVHGADYLGRLHALRGQTQRLDPDTAVSADSVDAAYLAAGAAVQAVEDVLSKTCDNAFALVRPPGHHAEANTAMGFCLLNNAAVAAEAALEKGLQRVLVLDWDVHHGNGTQAMFWPRRDVLYMSSHQFPFYPGTGAARERGEGVGEGFTVNCALPGAQADADFGALFADVFLPIAEQYRPELIIVSAGFDAHRADPLGGMNVTERGFAAMTFALDTLAQQCAGGKLVLLLEGGYDLNALAHSVHACVEVMTGARREDFPSQGVLASTAQALAETRSALKPFWKLGCLARASAGAVSTERVLEQPGEKGSGEAPAAADSGSGAVKRAVKDAG